jgi:multiple sugar transport system substrate-binding protein
MKKIVFVLAATVLILAQAAAGGQQSSGSSASTGGTSGGKLSVMVYTSAASAERVKNAAVPFEQQNKTEVEIIITPLADYDQKMSTMIAGNTAPDVYWVAEYAVPQYYENGIMHDLSGLKNDRDWDFSDFAQGQQNHWTHDGKLIGVPFSGAPLVLFYNKTMFQKAGRKTPTELFESGQWTVETMLDAAKALAGSTTGVYGIDFSRSGDWVNWDVCMTPVLRLYGGDAWSEDYRRVEINSPASLRGVQSYYDLLFTSKAHPMPGTTIAFTGGNLAMLPDLFSQVRLWVDLDFEWDVVPMPKDQSGKSTAWSGSAGYVVYDKSKNLKLASDFVKFITGKSAMTELMHTFVPTRMSVITSGDFRTGNNGQIMRPSSRSFDYCITDTLGTIRVKQPHPKYAQISQAIKTNLEAMYAGAMPPKAALDAMAKEMQPYMNK